MSDAQSDRVADYLLGLMSRGEADAFERELRSDPALAAAVEAAAARFLPLDETVLPIEPSQTLWQRIEERVDTSAKTSRSPAQGSLQSSLWDNLRFWRGMGLGGALGTAALAAVLMVFVSRPAPAPRFVAILVPADNGSAGAIVEVDASGAARLIPLQDITVPEGRALEVWTLQSAERGPVSIGLLDRAQSATLSLEALPPTASEQLFEITLEPATGSPTGRPTGPILFKGLSQAAL